MRRLDCSFDLHGLIGEIDGDGDAALVDPPFLQREGAQPGLVQRVFLGDGLRFLERACAQHEHSGFGGFGAAGIERSGGEHDAALFQLDLVRQVVTEPFGDFRRSHRPRDDQVHFLAEKALGCGIDVAGNIGHCGFLVRPWVCGCIVGARENNRTRIAGAIVWEFRPFPPGPSTAEFPFSRARSPLRVCCSSESRRDCAIAPGRSATRWLCGCPGSAAR